MSGAGDAAAAAVALALRDRLVPARDRMLADIAALVEIESPSGDVAALGRAADWLEPWLAPLGTVRPVVAADGRRNMLVETPGAGAGGPAPLILCHYDTVWPVGTLAGWGFAIDGDRASGPGVFDMKASIVCARHALLTLRELGVPSGARLLVSADEEIGNRTSRELIRELAQRSSAALVLEPPLDDGRLKTARKGHGTATVSVTGRAAHAGVAPERGINAIAQLAPLVSELRAIEAAVPGASVTPGRICGGGPTNVVPDHASLGIDLRAWTAADMAALAERLQELQVRDPGARIEVDVTIDRPPLERTPAGARLLERCVQVGRALGLAVREGSTGGCSEGNLVQEAGTPVLDGLGVRGAGPHTREERIELGLLVEQTALIGALVADLAARPEV